MAKIKENARRQKEIKKGLIQGLHISIFNNLEFPAP